MLKILLVDDDPRLRELLSIALQRAGWQVVTAADGQSALMHAAREAPDLIVLDIGLPEMDGLEVCRRIRARSEVPILFLSARDDELDRILGLELGADDYVTKPFSPREVVARIQAITKRARRGERPEQLRHGMLELDRRAHRCLAAGQDVALTAREFEILAALIEAPERLLSRAALVDRVWGRAEVSDRTLDSHLRNLRAKLEGAGCGDAIETLHGVGLRMKALSQ